MSAIPSDPTAALRSQPPGDQIVRVRVLGAGKELELARADGATFLFSAEMLWRECPSAQGKMRRMNGRAASTPPGLRIVALSEIGRYAVNIVFSDGHDRGIYPWSYLSSLGRHRRIEDYIITEEASWPRGRANHF